MKISLTATARRTTLALAGAAVAALIVSGGLLHAQAETAEAVIYKQCLKFPERTVWGRFPECGVDEEATRELQDRIGESTRPLTTEEEGEIQKYLDRQFAAPGLAAKQAELLVLMDWTMRRIEALLQNETYRFSATDRTALQRSSRTLQQSATANKDRQLTRSELDALSAELRGIVSEVSAIVGDTPRETPADTPRIESLVTRIDALVARVGTVIRDLEREGLTVPRSVRDGHAHALELVRESKQTCSTRRPASCSKLGEVLDTIEAMREPLCALKSDFLAQICN